MKIMILGDVHGGWQSLNYLINVQKPDIILQCGDFGYWPEYEEYDLKQIENNNTKIYWCDGNHERHDKLRQITDNEVAPNIFYMKRGATLTLPDGRVVLFMGGADSIDKHWRTPGVDWFPEEILTQKDFDNLSSPMPRIDIVISHTCPQEFDMREAVMYGNMIDPSREVLSEILTTFFPDKWYFGHWHFYKKGRTLGCEWTCLNENGRDNWWAWLD